MATELTAGEMSAALGTQGAKVSVSGGDLRLRPMNLAQVADALEVLARLSSRGAAVSALLAGGDFNPAQMLLRGGRDVLDLLAVAVSDPAKYLDDAEAVRAESLRLVAALDAADGARLLGAVYGVNRDFFLRNREAMLEAAAPVIGDAGALVDAVVARLSLLLSRLLFSSSSPTGTASETSADTPSASSATSPGR